MTINYITTDTITDWLKEHLSEERFLHTMGVYEMAEELAEKFGADKNKAGIAALLHDCAKEIPFEEMQEIAYRENLAIDKSWINCKKILHAPISAYLAKTYFKISDKEIIDAIYFHTVGKKDMTLLDKIVFIADKIETKTREIEYAQPIRDVLNATNSLDKAILKSIELTIKSLVDRELEINFQTVDFYNYLLKMSVK